MPAVEPEKATSRYSPVPGGSPLSIQSSGGQKRRSSRRWSVGGTDRARLSKSTLINWRSVRDSREQESPVPSVKSNNLCVSPSYQDAETTRLRVTPQRSKSLRLPTEDIEHPNQDLRFIAMPDGAVDTDAKAKRRKVLRAVFSMAKTLSRFTKASSTSSAEHRQQQKQQRRRSSQQQGPSGRQDSADPQVGFVQRGPSFSITDTTDQQDMHVQCSLSSSPLNSLSSPVNSAKKMYSGDVEGGHLLGGNKHGSIDRRMLSRRSLSMEDVRSNMSKGQATRMLSCDDCTGNNPPVRSNSMSSGMIVEPVVPVKARSASLFPSAPGSPSLFYRESRSAVTGAAARRQRKSLTILMKRPKGISPRHSSEDVTVPSPVYLSMCAEFERLLAPVRGQHSQHDLPVSPVASPKAALAKPAKPKRVSISPNRDRRSSDASPSPVHISSFDQRPQSMCSKQSVGSMDLSGRGRSSSASNKPTKPKRLSRSKNVFIPVNGSNLSFASSPVSVHSDYIPESRKESPSDLLDITDELTSEGAPDVAPENSSPIGDIAGDDEQPRAVGTTTAEASIAKDVMNTDGQQEDDMSESNVFFSCSLGAMDDESSLDMINTLPKLSSEMIAGDELEDEPPVKTTMSLVHCRSDMLLSANPSMHRALCREASTDSLDSRNIKWRDDYEPMPRATLRRSMALSKQDGLPRKIGILHQENLMRQWSTRRSKIKRHSVARRIIESYEQRENEVMHSGSNTASHQSINRVMSKLSSCTSLPIVEPR